MVYGILIRLLTFLCSLRNESNAIHLYQLDINKRKIRIYIKKKNEKDYILNVINMGIKFVKYFTRIH